MTKDTKKTGSKLATLNHAQRAVFARALYIHRSRLSELALKQIVEVRG